MKVSELLDDIFFRNGDDKFLPLLKNFAGNDDAEIFGISEIKISTIFSSDGVGTRVLIIMPYTTTKDINQRLYKMYIGNSTGEFERITGLYNRNEILGLYSVIMADKDMRNMATGSDLQLISKVISGFAQRHQKENTLERHH